MADQVFRVPVSPAQRFLLLQWSHAEGQKMKGQAGRIFRRFLRAFGLTAILDTMEEHPVPPGRPQTGKIRNSNRLAMFELTSENVEYALGLEEEHVAAVERTIGPLYDLLEDIKLGRYEAPGPSDVPPYDSQAEDWRPDDEDPVEAAAKQIVAHLRAAGELNAADLVERGGWDKPAPNGAQKAGPVAEASPSQ